jgi:hypothetical protein
MSDKTEATVKMRTRLPLRIARIAIPVGSEIDVAPKMVEWYEKTGTAMRSHIVVRHGIAKANYTGSALGRDLSKTKE